MFLLVAHTPSRYDRRHDEHTTGVFVCEELATESEVEGRIQDLLTEHSLDDDEINVYTIVEVLDEFGDACWSSNIAERFISAPRQRVFAAQQAAEERAAVEAKAASEAKRLAVEKAERTYFEKLKAKYESPDSTPLASSSTDT